MEINTKQKDKIENIKEQVQEIQNVFIGRIKPKKGHTLYEINPIKKTISVAKFDEQPALKFTDAMNGFISANKKVTKKEGCIYISALNVKNAIKILNRDFGIKETFNLN